MVNMYLEVVKGMKFIVKKYPKVLVVSHNPFSKNQNNGKTLASFFKDWPSNRLSQLFLTLDEIDSNICNSFFRISDVEILKSWIFCNKNYGNIITKDNLETFNFDKKNMHRNKIYIFVRNLFQKRFPLMMLFRSFVWKRVKPWKNEKLNDWILKEKPDVIFFQSSNVYAIFDMVEYIADRYNIPIVMETTDDYVTTFPSLDIFKYINIYKMQQRYQRLVSKAYCVIAIGDEMKKEYTRRFGGDFKVAMNSINISNQITEYVYKNNNLNFVYTGNLGLNRWKVLAEIGEALKQIYLISNINCRLNIYSFTSPNQKFQKIININEHINFCGKIDSQKLIEIRNDADMLVHVESFDKKNVEITRLSISTKIPEYLVSKRCVLAVGPSNVASIKYLSDNNIALVINDCKDLPDKIFQLIKDENQIQTYIERGYKVALERHNINKNSDLITNCLINAVKEIGENVAKK